MPASPSFQGQSTSLTNTQESILANHYQSVLDNFSICWEVGTNIGVLK